MLEFSCKDCGNRFPGCHGTCETYKAEKAEHDRIKAENDRKKAISGAIISNRGENVYKAMKIRKFKKY